MPAKPSAAFLDFATIGPGVDTARLDEVVDARYFDFSEADEILARLDGCEVALLNKTKIDRGLIESAGGLKLIVVAATGLDNVDADAANEAGVAVANVRDYCSDAVAQHVFALVLGLTQQVGPYAERVREGAWSQSRSFALFDFPIRELTGLKLGIVGYGSLGRAVARIGQAFGMTVLVSGRVGCDASDAPDRVPFDALLEEADVLSLHCPLNDATRHMLDATSFRRMKRDAIVVNTARGSLIDQEALAEALRKGEIGGAAVDVLPEEPPSPDAPLLAPDIPNLIVTPHIAWAAREARQRVIDQVAENVASFYAGGDLRRIV
ncbi:MAG TPA: D-2-hydroxyacid dehydrogenase [Gammaproteobacteria bacterium]|nr:D-2-hydroxyacid dehydrogenase [Gammaproteobacteria bacterium]